MSRRRVEFSFEGQQGTEPVIYQLSRKFALVPNIRRAMIENDMGWVVLELDGERDQIDSGLDWIRSLGVSVRFLDGGDIIEGD
jgi:ABC-type methionine transport system ATPase subunit